MTDTIGSTATGRDSLLGQVIDNRFEVIRRIGRGAMGEVYLARQLSLDLPRALKVIGASDGMDPTSEGRFRREALAMSRLQHAHIAQVIDFGRLSDEVDAGGHYLVMEHIEGASLQQVIDERRSLSLPETLTVVTKIADAIAYAHSRGIVHRDLKPSNILLQDRNPALLKVIDFGLAKLSTDEAQTQLTGDQQILGTPLFMSPEQCLSQEVGAPADLYGLAGIAYYALSGKPVFLEKTITAILMAQTYHTPIPLSERCPQAGVPAALDDLLLRCLRKAPGERPTAPEVVDRLQEITAWLATQPGLATPPAPRAVRPSDSLEALAGPRLSPEGHESASSILERPEALASAIWHSRSPGEDGHPAPARSRRQEGLFNQLTGLLLEFAEELQHHLNLTASVGVIAHRIETLQEAITSLEMELALLDSALEELGRDPHPGADAQRKRTELELQVGELTRSQNAEFRTLYLYVVSYRKEVHDAALLAYYAELERLIREYLDEQGRSQAGQTR